MRSALVFNGEHYGTLAAIRFLSQAGFKVYLAEAKPFAPGSVSVGLFERVVSPDIANEDQFMDWLMKFGREHKGTFLYPVSDVTCWLFSKNGDKLREFFDLQYPGPEVIRKILLKTELNRAAEKVGIDYPQTWEPLTISDVEKIAAQEPIEEGFVVKPKTQMGQKILHKGFIILNEDQLVTQYNKFLQNYPSYPIAGLTNQQDCLPMIQRYVASSLKGVFSVAGFINKDGTIFHTQGSVKTLQRPARMGIGLCFESFDLPADLSEKVKKLCLELGYFGIFEVEFLMTADNKSQIIDFNCRYYSQMSFDIKRGLNGLGAMTGCTPLITVPPESQYKHYRYSLSWYLMILCIVQFFMLNFGFTFKWLNWLFFGKGKYIDKVSSRSDFKPLIADVIQTVKFWILHPRSSFFSLIRV
jgi:predicted ATP-grasp superfamily ATP-dependent carboligase